MSKVSIVVAVVGSQRAWRMWVFQNTEKFVTFNRAMLNARDPYGREYFNVDRTERLVGRNVHEVIELSDADAVVLAEAHHAQELTVRRTRVMEPASRIDARLEILRQQFEDLLGCKIEAQNDNLEWALCAIREINEQRAALREARRCVSIKAPCSCYRAAATSELIVCFRCNVLAILDARWPSLSKKESEVV